MSNSDWEQGTIVLPSAEFAKVRQAVQQAEAKHLGHVYDLTQEFWTGLSRKQQTDGAAYREASMLFSNAKADELERARSRWRTTPDDLGKADALSDFSEAVELDWRTGKPARVLKSDMKFPTNRTTVFSSPDFDMTFDKQNNTVHWHVPENNHAVDDAHNHPVSKALFGALGDVRWTRGTGGVFTGNDEYRNDDQGEGGGSNYVTTAFGPIGAERAIGHCQPFLDSKGKRVGRREMEAIQDDKVKAVKAAQAKARRDYEKSVKASGVQPRGHNGHAGQYTYRTNGEPGFRL